MGAGSSRREFLRRTGLLTGGVLAAGGLVSTGDAWAAPVATDPWQQADLIAARVRPPRFAHRYFDVTHFGAVGDGTTDCTAAFRAAIRACAHSGGGHVVVPAGRFATGAIHLLSGVDLHITQDATIAFVTDPRAYLPVVLTRFEGTELHNYSPMIYAYGQHEIGITGRGTVDAQSDNAHWWPWCGSAKYGWQPGQPRQTEARDRLRAMAEQGVPVEQRVFGEGGYLRPNFIQPYRCRNVLIEGITVVNSPMWEIHPVLSENVLVRGVTVRSHGPNNDGCDPESSRDVVIRGCTFDTGDDCIAIKSGRNADGRRVNVPSERILIENCEFRAGHGGVTVGSEMSGGVRDVFARDLHLSSPDLNTALRFKTNSVRGGFIENVHARDITVGTVASSAIEIDFNYEEGPGHGFNPLVRGIDVRDMTVDTAQRALSLRGYADDPVQDVRLTRVNFKRVGQPDIVEHVTGLVLREVFENGQRLPDTAS
ncbi:glycoside hydrolase family 28 protein [Goodfellowiella coeruleoviolacea]|uniref:Pectate lyase superfamily protein n=1 Tax=Goodfellowiella coeruleoviolacea TaxID=334858 RepID=A0AAE3KIC5_9PSEU|nr:glycoside hydrolase family 28 protein [Goodfellowiella coeruleoviolacea]MCP2167827.1 Pectate lyase superfamily protein [Goodfellowiella coeruleoviolacea]